MGLRLKRYGPLPTIVVVGRLPGTGVAALRNVRVAEMNRAAATNTVTPPSGNPTARGRNRMGQAKWSNRPKTIAQK